ncbi:MAG: hypothetical protein WB492_03225 [Christiangramia sp.]
MMSIKVFKLLIVGLFFISCEQEQIDSTELNSANNLEEFNLESISRVDNDQNKALANEANSGAQVIRYNYDYGFRFTDDETQMEAWVNVRFQELCYGNRIRDLIDIKDVLIPENDGTDRIITLWKGQDVEVNVYEYNYETCEEYENAEPLYSGVGDFVWTDNNYGLVEEGDKNSVGFRLHGDGISIKYSLLYNGKTIKTKTRITLK